VSRLLGAVTVLTCALAGVAPAKDAPSLSLKDLSGAQHSITEYQGKVVVLNFWATWCGPCRHELPMLSDLAARYGYNVMFVAASLDDSTTLAHVPQYLKDAKITLPVWTGASTSDLDRLHLGIMLPATMVIDTDGTPITRIEGQAREKDITSAVDWALQGHSGRRPKALVKRY